VLVEYVFEAVFLLDAAGYERLKRLEVHLGVSLEQVLGPVA